MKTVGSEVCGLSRVRILFLECKFNTVSTSNKLPLTSDVLQWWQRHQKLNEMHD